MLREAVHRLGHRQPEPPQARRTDEDEQSRLGLAPCREVCRAPGGSAPRRAADQDDRVILKQQPPGSAPAQSGWPSRRGGVLLQQPLSMGHHDLPVRGVPLRWRLGLSTSVIVALVLGSLTFFFQRCGVERSREDHERLMGLAAAPALRIGHRERPRHGGVPGAPARLRRGALAAGVPAPSTPCCATGAASRSTRCSRPLKEPPAGALRARGPSPRTSSPAGAARSRYEQSGGEFEAMVRRRWRFWILSIAAAIASILLSLYIACQLLINATSPPSATA